MRVYKGQNGDERGLVMPDNEPLSTQNTPWLLILSAQGPDADPAVRRECLDVLFTQYRKPIIRFFRRLGFTDPNDGDDMTQHLFVRIMEKNLIDRLDPAKGRFRSYIKAVARSVAHDVRRDRGKHHPLSALSSTPPACVSELPAIDHDGPNADLNREWARATLDLALDTFRRECTEEGLTHWLTVFEQRTLPVSDESTRLSTAALAGQLNMDIKQVKNIVVRSNARFREHIRRTVRRTVRHESDVQAEIDKLYRYLSE